MLLSPLGCPYKFPFENFHVVSADAISSDLEQNGATLPQAHDRFQSRSKVNFFVRLEP